MAGDTRKQKKRFDGNAWYERTMDRRTRAALRMENEEFERDHAGDSREQLLRHLEERALRLGRAPQMCEVPGAKLIASRFGTWSTALRRLGYNNPTGTQVLEHSQRYKAEYARQQALYRAERKESEEQSVRQRKEKKAKERKGPVCVPQKQEKDSVGE